jgi:small ligand-binding sensory domain FIST
VPYAAALSLHPLPTHATGEVVGDVLEQLDGRAPDLALLFVTRPHVGVLEDIAASVRAMLAPVTMVAATAVSVLGGGEEAEEVPAVSLWAGHTGLVRGVALDAANDVDGTTIVGLEAHDLDGAGALVLLADPASFPVDALLSRLVESHPDLPVIGGMASAGFGPGANRLVVDDRVLDRGAVGVLLPPTVGLRTVVSQGCEPIGQPLTVTRSERNMVHEIAGRPALDRLQEVVAGLSPEDRSKAAKGLHIGRVIDEHRSEFGRGDFLIRNVLGADRGNGAVAIGDEVSIGETVQFHVRDADSADRDLRALLAGERASGALVFTCNGRGTHLFGEANHDASVVADSLATPAVAGMFCAGEIGPVGSRNFVHGFTACVALFP